MTFTRSVVIGWFLEEAESAGGVAASLGLPRVTCPYGTERDFDLRNAWLVGWQGKASQLPESSVTWVG